MIGNNSILLDSFVASLSIKFTLKDFSDLSYFIGVEVLPTSSGMFLSQEKYTMDIHDKTGMSEVKDVSIPMLSNVSLHLSYGKPLSFATQFRQIVGHLQYFSLTRPNIAFTVNKLSQFMHLPTDVH